MLSQQKEVLQQLVENQKCIRNVSLISYCYHGKSTVSDQLIEQYGIEKPQEKYSFMHYTDILQEEKCRNITIHSHSTLLKYKYLESHDQSQDYLIHLIDTPGCLDYIGEIEIALRLTDGVLLIIDITEQIRMPFEIYIKAAQREKQTPVLFFNMLDKALNFINPEVIYQNVQFMIEQLNILYEQYAYPHLSQKMFIPEIGNIAFGSGIWQFGFTLENFVDIYTVKFKVNKVRMREKL